MTNRFTLIRALVTMALSLSIFQSAQPAAADINILPYYINGAVGDSWTYTFKFSPEDDFTVKLTLVDSGVWFGKYRMGDFVDIIDVPHLQYHIADWDSTGITVYATERGVLSTPVKLDAVQPFDTIIANPFSDDEDVWYVQKLSSLTVAAGTFYDGLVLLHLDTTFGPTRAIDAFGLDPTIAYGVTHVEWMAAGIGRIQDRDYNELGTMLFEYQLKATSVPLPGSLLLLGSGLAGLIGLRRKYFS